MELYRAVLNISVGQVVALASETALCALEFDTGTRMTRLEARLAQFYGSPRLVVAANGVHARAQEWLEHYLAGSRLPEMPELDARGTPFEVAVWHALSTIPIGTTTTYGRVAVDVTGSAAASRAVGLANGANPIAIIVPCHRVIGSDGTLTGYGGGLDRKQWLLDHEERYWPTGSSVSRVSRTSRQRTLELSL
jgi:O-6-methylguanine DNA methyltransferase